MLNRCSDPKLDNSGIRIRSYSLLKLFTQPFVSDTFHDVGWRERSSEHLPFAYGDAEHEESLERRSEGSLAVEEEVGRVDDALPVHPQEDHRDETEGWRSDEAGILLTRRGQVYLRGFQSARLAKRHQSTDQRYNPRSYRQFALVLTDMN